MTNPIETPRDVAEWVQRHIYAGQQPADAAMSAFEEMQAQGREMEVLRALGHRWLFYAVWQTYNRKDRFVRHEDVEEEQPIEEPSFVRQAPRNTGVARGRRVDLALVRDEKSLYSKLVNLGNREWVPLGQLTRAQCLAVSASYRQRAAANTHLADTYERLANGLEDETTTVRDRFSEAELDEIWPAAA